MKLGVLAPVLQPVWCRTNTKGNLKARIAEECFSVKLPWLVERFASDFIFSFYSPSCIPCPCFRLEHFWISPFAQATESLPQPHTQLGRSFTLSRAIQGHFLCILIPQASLRVAARFEADGEVPLPCRISKDHVALQEFPSADWFVVETGWWESSLRSSVELNFWSPSPSLYMDSVPGLLWPDAEAPQSTFYQGILDYVWEARVMSCKKLCSRRWLSP